MEARGESYTVEWGCKQQQAAFSVTLRHHYQGINYLGLNQEGLGQGNAKKKPSEGTKLLCLTWFQISFTSHSSCDLMHTGFEGLFLVLGLVPSLGTCLKSCVCSKNTVIYIF